MICNELKFNDSKIDSRWLSKQKLEITIGNAVIKPSQFVRNLIAVFDNTMCMYPHIVQQTKNVLLSTSLGKVRLYLNKSACAAKIHVLVTSRLDYPNSLFAGLPDIHQTPSVGTK